MSLATQTDEVGGKAVVSVRGDVDLVSSDQLRRVLDEALHVSPELVVDLAGLTFIDSSGLSALVEAHRKARDAGGVVVLRHPTPMLRRLLAITRLETLLVVDDAPPEPAATGDEA